MRNDSELKKLLTEDVAPKLPDIFVTRVMSNIRQNNSYEIFATHEGLMIHNKRYVLTILMGLIFVTFFIAHHYQQKSIETELQKIDALSASTLQVL